MFKRFSALALAFAIVLSLFAVCIQLEEVSAASTYTPGQYSITEKVGVNYRKGPGTQYAKLGAYKYGTIIQVLEVKNGWGKTSDGWLKLSFTKKLANPAENYMVTEQAGLNYRKGPGTQYAKLGAYKYGTTVQICEVKNGWGRTPEGYWINLAYTKKISGSGNATTVTTSNAVTGIPASAYKNTGVVYTVGESVNYACVTTRAYNGVAAGEPFFVDDQGKVVTNSDTLNKLSVLVIFNNCRLIQKANAETWAQNAQEYNSIYTSICTTKKMGEIIGKGSGALLGIGAGCTWSLQESLIELGDSVVSLDTLKAASFLSMVRFYTHNATAYGNQAAAAMRSAITDYDAMVLAVSSYAACAASFSAVEFLIGDQVRDMSQSTVWNELGLYFDNVVVSCAEALIPDLKPLEVAEAIYSGTVSLEEMAENCGALAVYDKRVAEQKAFLSKADTGAKTVADKLAEAESMKFVKALTSKYSTNITTQKWGAYFAGNGYHLGTDLGSAKNKSSDVVSIADGVVYRVVKESQSAGWGNMILVKHTLPNGKVFYSGYAHLKSMSVKEGTTVTAGTKLGVMGSSGYSTGPHLHLLCFSGSFSKSSLPKGYVSKKITGDSCTVGGLTYYNPLKVISSNGSIIK